MDATGDLGPLPVTDHSTLPAQCALPGCGVRRAAQALANWIGGLCEAIAIAMLRRYLRRVLCRLNGRLLADFGIKRSDIDTIAKGEERVLWRHVV